MKSTCTDMPGCAAMCRRSFSTRGLRRGNAEIETLLVILFVILPILFIVVFAGTLGKMRLDNVFNAENNAYTQAVDETATASEDETPVVGDFEPNIPSRFATAEEVKVAQQTQGQQSVVFAPVRIEDKAWFLDTAWEYPNNEDQKAIHDWFNAYVYQDHSDALDYSLGISPPGPP